MAASIVPRIALPSRKRGRKAQVTEDVAMQLVAVAERLMMWGFPGKTAFEAAAAAGRDKQRGMAGVGADRIKQLHRLKGHLVRGSFSDVPPPSYAGKWPPPRRWMFTKESLVRLNPRRELKARELAALLLRSETARPTVRVQSPADGQWYEEDADLAAGAPVLPLESAPKWAAAMEGLPRMRNKVG